LYYVFFFRRWSCLTLLYLCLRAQCISSCIVTLTCVAALLEVAKNDTPSRRAQSDAIALHCLCSGLTLAELNYGRMLRWRTNGTKMDDIIHHVSFSLCCFLLPVQGPTALRSARRSYVPIENRHQKSNSRRIDRCGSVLSTLDSYLA
jgi:hypothetical protein